MKLLMINADDGETSVLVAKDLTELKSKFNDELHDAADNNCQLIKCEGAGEDQKFYVAEVEVIDADDDDPESEEEIAIEWQLVT